MLKLVKPDEVELSQIVEFIHSFSNETKGIAGLSSLNSGSTSDEIEKAIDNRAWEHAGQYPKLVPSEQFFTYDLDSNNLVGCINFRPLLSPRLISNFGFNIGYSISPRYRGLGYSKIQLELMKDYIKSLGFDHVYIGASANNTPSVRCIKSSGGEEVYRVGSDIAFKIPLE